MSLLRHSRSLHCPLPIALAAALSALELGHLEPRVEDLTGMAPPAPEALEQTVTALWSDLFATLSNTSLERDIEDLGRSEEHTSELQSLMRISYDDLGMKKKKYSKSYDSTVRRTRT